MITKLLIDAHKRKSLDSFSCAKCSSRNFTEIYNSDIDEVKEEIVDENHIPVDELIFLEINMIVSCSNCMTKHFIRVFSESYDWPYISYLQLPRARRLSINYKPIGEVGESFGKEKGVRESIDSLFTEALNAVENDCFTLAGMGVRSVLEQICKLTNREEKTLHKSIIKLEKEGILEQNELELCVLIKNNIGNPSVHEARINSKEDIERSLEFLDLLIDKLIRKKDVMKSLRTVIESGK